MRTLIRSVAFLAFAGWLVLMCGCAGRSGNPVQPSTSKPVDTIHQSASSPRQLMGLWTVAIDESRQSAEIVPARLPQMHLNVVRLLETAPCKTCLKIGNVKVVEPNVLEADLTLTHPYPGLLKYTGFDVRGIFIAQANYTFPVSGRQIAWGTDLPVVLNSDGYTNLFNPTEFPESNPGPPALKYIPGKKATGGDLSATLNPFLAYRRDAPRCMFESGGSQTRTVRLYAPPGPIHFGYAVDACWQLVENVVDPLKDFPPDANCMEAYKVKVDIPGQLSPTPGSQAAVYVEVFDHQGLSTISSVTIEAPDLFAGSIPFAYSTQTGQESWLFSGTITNETGMGDGFYPLLANVVDTDSDQNLGKIDAWQVSTVEVSTQLVSDGWARTWGGGTADHGHSVAVDGFGNVYVTGYFWGDSVDFDPGTAVDSHSSNGLDDAFLSKFDSSGAFVWARTWGGGGSDVGRGVSVDGSGNVYVTGRFDSVSVDFNPDPIEVDLHSPNGMGDIFLSKFDSSGTFMWARTWGGGADEFGYAVDADGSGNVYVTGYFFGDSVDFNPDPIEVDPHSSNGQGDIFLSKFDSSGTFVWARTWGGSDYDYGLGVEVDGSGNVYVPGYFKGISVDFDPDPTAEDLHSSNGSIDIFLSKFDSSGTFVWARTWGGSGNDYGYGCDVDGSGNVYVTGQFQGTSVDFNPDPAAVDPHSSNGEMDVFLSKFASSGTFVWARTWGGSSYDYGFSVDVDGSGNAYVTGYFNDVVDFNPDPTAVDLHSSNGDADIFLSKFKPDGSW